MSNRFKLGLIWLLASIFAFAGFSTFNDPRFIKDPFTPFYKYGDADSDDYKKDIEEISKRFGTLTKTQTNSDVQSLIDEVYDGLKAQYPKFMANKDKPQIAIVENEDFSALAAFSSRLIVPHGMLVIPNGFINAKKDRCAKMGLIAHEISHLFLHHSHPTVESPIIQVRYADGKEMSAAEKQAAFQYSHLSRHIGKLHYSEANGMQLSSLAGTGFQDFILSLYEDKGKLCGSSLKEKLRGQSKNIRSRNSEYHGQLLFETTESLTSLSAATSEMIRLIEQCVRTLPPEKNAIELGVSHKMNLIRNGIKHPALESSEAPKFSEYIELNKQVVSKMKTLKSQFVFDQLRTVTAEDQADEMAVGLLKHLNCSPEKYIELFKEEIKVDKERCETQIKAGKEPPFGDLSDSHHSFCWRFDYFTKYFKSEKQVVDGLESGSVKAIEAKPKTIVK